MGSYNTEGERKIPIEVGMSSALREFCISLLEAVEVEWIDMDVIKEKDDMPISFYVLNRSVDNLLEQLRSRSPEHCPPLRRTNHETTNQDR
jgi:predicted transcriptional regulator